MPHIDNFDRLMPLLDFESNDDYYLLELIGRKKDSVEVTHSQDHFGSYYITSKEMLAKVKPEIEALCKLKHCRAYLNPNPKSKKKTAMKLMKNLLGKMENDDYSKLFGAMTSAAGECGAQSGRKLFVIDVDDIKDSDKAVAEVVDLINSCKTTTPPEDWTFEVIPTVSGFHVICSPFDCSDFVKKRETALQNCTAEVKHNSPTLLYISLES